MSECGCVKVTPIKIKIIVGLGCAKDGVASAEKLEETLRIPLDVVLSELDGLLQAEVADDVDAEDFYLTDKGLGLFNAFYEATGAVVGGS